MKRAISAPWKKCSPTSRGMASGSSWRNASSYLPTLSHIVSKDDIQLVPSKVEAIVNAPPPAKVWQLRSVWVWPTIRGNLSQTRPLHCTPWCKPTKGSPDCARHFQDVRDQITSACVLTHYEPRLPITLAADASAYSVDTVISHVFPDGSKHPIAFASCTLTASERNYAQLQKEALSCVFVW